MLRAQQVRQLPGALQAAAAAAPLPSLAVAGGLATAGGGLTTGGRGWKPGETSASAAALRGCRHLLPDTCEEGLMAPRFQDLSSRLREVRVLLFCSSNSACSWDFQVAEHGMGNMQLRTMLHMWMMSSRVPK